MTKAPLVAWTLTVATLLVPDARVLSAQEFARAQATLNSCTDGAVVGSATLVEAPSSEGIKNVTILLSVRNLPAGNHAVHVHEVGACVPCSRRRESPRYRSVGQQRAGHRQSSVSQRRSHQRAGRVDRKGVHGARDQPRRDLRRQSQYLRRGRRVAHRSCAAGHVLSRPDRPQLRRWRPHRVRHPPAGSIAVVSAHAGPGRSRAMGRIDSPVAAHRTPTPLVSCVSAVRPDIQRACMSRCERLW